MRRCRAGTVSKAQRRAVVLGTSASTAEESQVLYCSGGRRIPSLRDGEVLVLPGRHTNPSEMPLFLKDGPAVDLMGSGGRECYGREASASTNSIPTSMGWAGHSCTSHAPPTASPRGTNLLAKLWDQPAGAHLPWDKAPGHPPLQEIKSVQPSSRPVGRRQQSLAPSNVYGPNEASKSQRGLSRDRAGVQIPRL